MVCYHTEKTYKCPSFIIQHYQLLSENSFCAPPMINDKLTNGPWQVLIEDIGIEEEKEPFITSFKIG